MKETLIEVKDISKVFASGGMFGRKKETVALQKVSFRVLEDETLALVGESGCGKTTIGRIILGMEAPTEGQVFFKGKEISFSRKDPEIRRNIQMVYQDPFASLDPKMRVEDILMEPLLANGVFHSKREGREHVKELLSMVGLDESHARRFPHQFSGGQRQRIGIARALALHPAFVICDEPVSALDVSVQAQILNLLRRMQNERKMSLLFISHDLGVVRYIADRIVVMYLGQICEIGDTEEVYNHPHHPYTEYLLQSVPKMRIPDAEHSLAEGKILKAGEGESISGAEGCPFYGRCAYRKDICRIRHPERKEQNGVTYYCHVR